MELQYIVLTIIKILISVPAIVLVTQIRADGAALIGGHINNASSKPANLTTSYDFKIDLSDESSQELVSNETKGATSEEIPDPSPLVVPGYNLPDNIFNQGKPFYLERDPLTGDVDFESKSSSSKEYEYDYEDEPMYDKVPIDRKDGPIVGHKASDINQLTPNIHDYLNLPVKYNPGKYVYPLISSSYANTKVQGNVNKQHGNHRNYIVTTYKPMLNPTYFTSKSYRGPSRIIEFTTESTPGTSRATTLAASTGYNLMNSGMNHPSFKTEYSSTTTRKPVELTTKKTLSLFEQIFGVDYEEGSTEEVDNALTTTTLAATTTTTLKPSQDFDDKSATTKEDFYDYEYDDKPTTTTTTTVKPTTTEKVTSLPLGENHLTTPQRPPLIFAHQNLREKLNGEKVDVSKIPPSTSNVRIAPDQDTVSFVVGNHQNVDGGSYVGTSLKESPYDANPFRPVYDVQDRKDTMLYNIPDKKDSMLYSIPDKKDSMLYNIPDKKDSMLYNAPDHKDVVMYNVPDNKDVVMYNVPDNKDVVMYNVPDKKDVVMYNFSDKKDVSMYNDRDVSKYNVPDKKDVAMYDKKDMVLYSVPDKKDLVPSGSSVTIQPVRQSEASLAIGVPVNRVQVKVGQVVDDKLGEAEYTKSAKIVFPDDRTTSTHPPDLSPPPPPLPNREVLKLSSKPMFHQLPSDLTPPTEKDSKIRQRIDRVRPPWDPRPGHFHTGRPEYARPPRPNQEIYKRVDGLPNILPQFRPNVKYQHQHQHHHQQHHQHHHHHGHHGGKNYARQPLLERPSNRPIGFFEKMQPPPPPLPPKMARRPVEEPPMAEEKADLQEPFVFLQAPPKVVVAKRKNGNDPETLQMIQAKQERKDVNVLVAATSMEASEKPLYVVYPVNTGPLKLDAIDTNKESVVIGTRAELPLPPSKIAQEKKDAKPFKEFNYEVKERHDSPILKPRPNTPMKSNFPYPLERPDPSVLSYEVPLDSVENHLPDEPAFSSNQWNTIESHEQSPISVTLKTYTDRPIAVAYTPTEPHLGVHHDSKDEFTVSAVMRTRPQKPDRVVVAEDSTVQDFHAPFLASAHIDHPMSQGWSVVKKDKDGEEETTTVPVVTTSEFNIENFRPQLEGGFKPIYNYPDAKKELLVVNERQE